jgi:hypothetical protein
MSSTANGDTSKQVVAAFDGPASFYYILQKASDVDGFLNWLRDYHCITSTGKLLAGYKFLLGSIFKGFLNEIYVNTALELSQDETIFRAQFKGVPLRDTPNTCEKTILLKRIWSHGKAVSKAKTWPDVREATRQMKVDLDVFRQLIEGHCRTTTLFDKEYVIQAIASDHVFTFLNDTSHNIPLAELTFPSIEQTATEKYLSDAFPGYVYGLQYLWYSILGGEEFGQTSAKNLHLVLDEEEVKKHPRQKSHFEEMLENGEKLGSFTKAEKVDKSDLDEEVRGFIEAIKRDSPPSSERWAALDRFYKPIQEEIVRPREAKLKVVLGMSHLLVLEEYTKDLLKGLLDSNRVTQPDYLTKNDDSSHKKQLSLTMLWYDVNVLDTQSLLVFNGVPAFASTLLGSVELAKAFRSNEPVKAIVFKHPAGMENQFNYSFGILIQAYSSIGISDYSGWLIFFDCATDHSGFGGSLLGFAKAVIQIAQQRGPICLNEIVVEKELFKEYLKEHSVSSVFDTLIKETPVGTKEVGSLTTILTELDDFLAKAKGKLLEHVVHKWIRESQGFGRTACDIWVNGEQIDCTGEIGNSLSFFECKLNMHQDTIDDTINQINRKSRAFSKENQRVEAWLVVYGMIPADTKMAFEKNGIFVRDNFKSVIAEQRCFDSTRKETLEILDWQFRTPGKFRPRF